jgi:tetratricopeptide (TPR) repeat protein
MRFRIIGAVIVLNFLPLVRSSALDWETNSPSAPAGSSGVSSNADDVLRTYLQLQGQIHEAQQAIESMRQEAEYAAATNAAALSNRLQAIEQSLNDQRVRELETVRSTNRVMLIIAGTFVGVGLLALLLTAYMHWRAVNRLAEIASALPVSQAVTSLPLTAIGMGESRLLPGGMADPAGARLLGALEQLEKRILELEHHDSSSAHAPLAGDGASAVSAPAPKILEASIAAPTTPSTLPDQSARISMLLGKGQSLLSLDKAEEALACFDEVLGLDANNTDALVKKGAALEKLRRLQEAIECYDRAIAADGSLTIAYLYKGGLFNRMERFSEAMQCYEKALHTQEKERAA